MDRLIHFPDDSALDAAVERVPRRHWLETLCARHPYCFPVILPILVLAVLTAACDHKEIAPEPEKAPNVAEVRARAEAGDPEAQQSLACLYAKGLGVPQSYPEAIKWYRRAADRTNVMALTALGEFHEAGQGVPMNEAEAAKLYQQAAERGYAPAQYNLAVLYGVGRGVPMNVSEAVKWYQRAADQGDSLAQYNLGMRYYEGKGVGPDPVVAYQWLSLAAAQKMLDAEKARNELKRSMTREQIAEGHRRVSEFTLKFALRPKQ